MAGSERSDRAERLTPAQRDLVAKNLGLIAVEIKHTAGPLRLQRRSRTWDDLFQEGSLGLIEAARSYRAGCNIPFAAFALARIHRAVSEALHRDFESHRPVSAGGACRASKPADGSEGGPDAGVVETVGDRLRGKYERALRAAAREAIARRTERGDRTRLVRALVAERYLIPEEESRLPLRQVARSTGSSVGRVVECDRRIRHGIAEALRGDPEFRALLRLAKTHPMGLNLAIDAATDRRLARAGFAEFARRCRRSNRGDRAAAIADLLAYADLDPHDWAATLFERLPPATRERLWRKRADSRRKDPFHEPKRGTGSRPVTTGVSNR